VQKRTRKSFVCIKGSLNSKGGREFIKGARMNACLHICATLHYLNSLGGFLVKTGWLILSMGYITLKVV
jgi:hypothetical protein